MNRQLISLVTGTSRGIGLQLAKHYLKEGHLVIGCSRTSSPIKHKRYEHHFLDLTDEQCVVSLFSNIRKKYKRLDVLINNAGTAAMNHSITTPVHQVRSIFETNVISVFHCSREAAKIMQINLFGRIINFSSSAVIQSLEGESAYTASKAAVESLTQVFAREYSRWGITVNAVAPSPVQTDLIKNIPKKKIETLIYQQAIKRYCTPSDIENVVDFLLKQESSFITGQIIRLGGI
jgi:3-oxoacyl-[acyl-carrier protein] reductase